MASIASIVGGLLALSSPVIATVFESSDNLISLAGQLDKRAPVIRTGPTPEVLQPLRPLNSTDTAKTPSQDALAIRDEDVLYWGGSDGKVAEFQIAMGDENEGLVNAEYFEDLIESMDCPRESSGQVNVRFTEQTDFDAAVEAWKSVAQDAEFLFVVGATDCGWNKERLLFRVQDLDTDETNTVILQADAVTWKDAISTYALTINKPDADSEGAQRLDASGLVAAEADFTIPLDADVTGKAVSFSLEGVDFTGTCTNCTVAGSIDVDAKFSVGFFELDEAAVELTTAGINAVAIITAQVTGQLLDKPLEQVFPIFQATPGGFEIPGIVTIGPTVELNLKAGVSTVKGQLTVTVGGTAAIPASTARLDFLEEEGNTAEGWTPQVETIPIEVDAKIEVKASVSLLPVVSLEISALGE